MGAFKRKVLETGIGMRVEIPTRLNDPDAEVFDLTIETLRDQAGDVVGLSCSGINITEMKRAEMARLQSQALIGDIHGAINLGSHRDKALRRDESQKVQEWAEAMDALSIGIVVVTADGQVELLNSTARKFEGGLQRGP